MPYARFKDAVAECNRSGWKMLRKEMVEDGYLKGLLVHPDWYDPPHPQEQPFDPDDPVAIYRPAPVLLPVPPSPVLSLNGNVFSWTQADPPASTILKFQVWRSVAAAPYVLVATILPVIPVDYFIQGPDQIKGDPTNSGISWPTYTDSTAGTYYVLVITADGGEEGNPGFSSAPSNIVTHP